MSQAITLLGASYTNVPAVQLPKTGGGTATFTDVTDTTATASDVASGKYFYTAAGVKTAGTGSGGGGSTVQVEYKTATGADGNSLSFTGLTGEPTSFTVICADSLSVNAVVKIAAIVYDGNDLHAQLVTNTNNAQASYDGSGSSFTYNNGTLTVTNTNGVFTDESDYHLWATIGGTAGNIHTNDVQVGSGATSITFTGLDDEPLIWAVIFKSNFSTSSGYQRVMAVTDWDGICGQCMDSGSHFQSSWTKSYNNGSFTVTSSGTNNGGYFHQPGYYQLTYAIGGDQTLQTKTVTPTESTQNVTADTAQGYTALKKVVVNPIPSEYIIPSGNYAITANGTGINVAQYATVSVAVPGGGGGVNVKTTTWTNNSTSTVTHTFSSLSGTPKAAFLRCTAQLTRSSSNTYYYIADIFWDGTNAYGNYHLRSNGSYNNVASDASPGFSVTTGTNSITFTSGASSRSSAPGSFYNGTYELTYIY